MMSRFFDLTDENEVSGLCSKCQHKPNKCICCPFQNCKDKGCMGFCFGGDDSDLESEDEMLTPQKRSSALLKVPAAPMKTASSRMRSRSRPAPYRKLTYEEAVKQAREANKREVGLLLDRYASYWRPAGERRARK